MLLDAIAALRNGTGTQSSRGQWTLTHLAKKLGDGLIAPFGYQVAQENDAEGAARAAFSRFNARSPISIVMTPQQFDDGLRPPKATLPTQGGQATFWCKIGAL
jgi:hypothetical protein